MFHKQFIITVIFFLVLLEMFLVFNCSFLSVLAKINSSIWHFYIYLSIPWTDAQLYYNITNMSQSPKWCLRLILLVTVFSVTPRRKNSVAVSIPHQYVDFREAFPLLPALWAFILAQGLPPQSQTVAAEVMATGQSGGVDQDIVTTVAGELTLRDDARSWF